jgi:hypothetical protein
MARQPSNFDPTPKESSVSEALRIQAGICRSERTDARHDADVVRRLLARWIAKQIAQSAKEKQ